MANNKTTYTLQIDAEINSLEKKLGTIQNLMQNVMNSADAPKGLEKSFEKIGSLIDKIRTKASAPIDSKSGFTSIGKDIEAVNIALGSLYKMIGSVGEMSEASRISFLPPEAQKEIATIIKSIEAYQAAITSATTETAELIEARKELAKAETAKSKADADLELKQQSLDRAKQEQKNAQAAIDAINERKAALDDLLKKQEEIEKFYNTEGADGKKPNRSKKYDGVSMRPQDIKRQIKNQEALMVGDADELEKQSKALKQAKIDVESYERQVGTAQRRWNDANETFNIATRAVEALNTAFESGSTEKKQAAYTALKTEASKLGITVSDLNDEFSETDAGILTQRLIELKQKGLAPVTDAMDRAQAETREMGNTAKQAGKDVKESAEAYKEMNDAAAQRDAFENKIKSFLGVAGAAQVMRHALRDAMQTISELDKTMTEMSVVTDLEVSDYWDQLPQYTKRANELGLAINDVYKADTLYYQQGLKTNEVVAISTETMKMARIAGLDTAEATDRMTAALRGFNMELNETSAAKIADVYSELAAITAADVDEISTAMTKTASIASSAGMEFETTAAFLSQIIETTRESAETAGTAMKTVIARFQELKKAPEDIGEVDGEIVDANAIETALRSVGVELRDAGGQFRELDDVFLELSSKWSSLDKNTQRYIATIAAGSRQQSRFIAMMSDYGRTQELVTAANNSAGASNRQFEKTMDSLESKIEKLKNTWHEFTMGIMDSDLVKAGVDILTKFLQIINNITSAFDGIGGSLAKIGSVLAIFKLGKVIFEKFRPMISTFLMSIVDDYKKAGQQSGEGFARGVQRGIRKAETTPESPEGENEKTKEGTLGRVENNSLQGKVSNMGLGVLDGIGLGYFMDAAQAGQNKRDARDNIVANKHLIESTPGGKQGINQRITEGQSALDQLDKDYIFEGDKVYKKGPRGGKKQLTKKEASKVKADRGEANSKISEATEELKAYEQAEIEIAKSEKEFTENSNAQWSSISKGLESASAAAAGVGIAFGAIGQAFEDAGFEEAGKVISGIGSAFMVLSVIMSIVSSIIPLLSAAFGTAGAAGVASGVATTSAWAVVGLIVMIVMAGIIAVVAVVLLMLNILKNASPEEKLKKASAAADEAAKAADAASESYNRLSDSLETLKDKYKNLEDLRKGTEEWNEAVQDINNSVLELISQYPELAALVENSGGVLTIELDSSEVKQVLASVKSEEVKAKGASLGASVEVEKWKREAELNEIDDEVFEKFVTDNSRAIGMAFANVGGAMLVGGATGAGVGAGIGALAAAVGAIPGLIAGAVGGAAAGLFTGLATLQVTLDAAQKSTEQNRENVKELAQAYANGETGTTVQEIADYVERNGIAAGDAAKQMAQALIDNSEEFAAYGESLNAMDSANKAYYQAMATNAQQLLDLGKYSENQINQMTAIVDDDLTKVYAENRETELKKQSEDSTTEEWENEKKNFAKSVYGENARVDGNKILDEAGNVVREFTDNNAWIHEMAAADATLQAAEAMKLVPDAINKSLKAFDKGVHDAVNKAFQGEDLTQGELNDFEKAMGTRTLKNEDGSIATDYDQLTPEQKEIWGSRERYEKSLDADYAGVDAAWKKLSDKEKKTLYGWDGTSEGEEKAKENFEDTFTEIYEAQTKAFEKAKEAADELGISLSNALSSSAAQGWTTALNKIAPGEGDVGTLNAELISLLSGLTTEEVSAVMGQINSMDMMDISAWDNLHFIFEDMGIDIAKETLDRFTEAGKQAAGAIRKIDFANLANNINEAYKLLDKIKEGGRTYSEEDYKALIAANKQLEKSFTRVGDDFIYTGASMEELTDAVKANTTALLGEAARQLKSRYEMSTILSGATESGNFGSIDAMDKFQLQNYLISMRGAVGKQGYDLADFGIAGLDMTTDFANATEEQLRTWAISLATEAGKEGVYEDYIKAQKDTNVQRYIRNDAQYNAEQAVNANNEFSQQHFDALVLQAIQSGGVSNELIEAYKNAYENKDYELAEELGYKIADQTKQIVESNKGREAYMDLVDTVTEALEQQAQEQIDKLSQLNDSINQANEQLINKIQQQIDEQRQARENEKTEKSISDLRSQAAYLGMDTSGANQLSVLDLDKQIAEEEEAYQDTLIDQAIQKLQDANEKAAEQRERQISLAEEQLNWQRESGELSRQAISMVDDSIKQLNEGTTIDQTVMGALLSETAASQLDELSAETFWSDITLKAVLAANIDDKPEGNFSGNEELESSPNPSLTSDDVLKELRDNAINNAKNAIESKNNTRNGAVGIDLSSYKAAYESAGGQNFEKELGNRETITGGSIDGVGAEGINSLGHYTRGDGGDEITITLDGTKYTMSFIHEIGDKNNSVDSEIAKQLNQIVGGSPENGWVAMYDKIPYVYVGGSRNAWYSLKDANGNFARDYLNKLRGYKTGGLANFTGPAWLDGTKSRPEYILNADQTKRFFSLIDVLERFDDKDSSDSKTGDNYFDIEINVEKLENDYDVEKIANKIRRMIYDDATYRNVNAVSMQ